MGLYIEKEEFINKTFRLNKKLVEKVDAVCADKNISMNKFVDIALHYALEHLEEDEET